MKKVSMMIATLALTMIFGSFVSAQAVTCTDDGTTAEKVGTTPRTATDPFGSCEDYKTGTGNGGLVKCGTTGDTDVAGVFTLIVLNTTSGTGVQGCSNKADRLPIGGRVSVYKDAANNVVVGVDGSDAENAGGASAWQRYDVRPGTTSTPRNTAVCARRGTAGTWWTGSTAASSSNPDSVNQGIDGNVDRTPCGGSPVPA